MLKDIIPVESAMLQVDYFVPVHIIASEKCTQQEILLKHHSGQATVSDVKGCCCIAPWRNRTSFRNISGSSV